MSEITATNLENQKKDLQAQVELAKAIDRLSCNRDFKTVILDHFMVKEASRFVHSSIDFNLDDAKRKDALAMAQASGYLKQFLQVTSMIGKQAENVIGQIDDELDIMRNVGEDE